MIKNFQFFLSYWPKNNFLVLKVGILDPIFDRIAIFPRARAWKFKSRAVRGHFGSKNGHFWGIFGGTKATFNFEVQSGRKKIISENKKNAFLLWRFYVVWSTKRANSSFVCPGVTKKWAKVRLFFSMVFSLRLVVNTFSFTSFIIRKGQ